MTRFLVCLLVVVGLAPAAQAYDSRPGDALIELRSGLAGSTIEASQFLHETVRAGLMLGHAWSSPRTATAFGLSVGYEGHQRGYAIVPRGRAALAMGLLRDGGLGLAAQLDGGLVWYVVRNVGLELHTGAQLWGRELLLDVGGGVVLRW